MKMIMGPLAVVFVVGFAQVNTAVASATGPQDIIVPAIPERHAVGSDPKDIIVPSAMPARHSVGNDLANESQAAPAPGLDLNAPF